MGNLIKKRKIKRCIAIVVILIIAMIMANVLPLVSAGADAEDVKYAKFDANFESIVPNQETFNAQSNTAIAITYNIALSGIPTGYQELQLRVIDEDTNNPKAKLVLYSPALYLKKAEGDTLFFDASVPSCTIKSTLFVEYDRTADFSEYDKDIKLLLTGTYLNPFTKEVETISEEKVLTAHVIPSDLVRSFYVQTDMEQNKAILEEITENPQSEIAKKLGKIEWKLSSFTNPYNITIVANNVSYLEYTLKLTRTEIPEDYKQQAVSEENLMVTCESLKSAGFNVEFVERNTDGTAVLKITKGTKDAPFNKENLFSVNGKYPILVSYNIVEPLSRSEGNTTGSFITDITGFAQGYKTNENKNGIVANNMEEYSYDNGFVQGIVLKQYYSGLFGAGTSIFSWTKERTSFMNKSEQEGKMTLEYLSDVYAYDYRPEKFKRNLFVSTEKAEVEYIDENGETKVSEITNLINLENIKLNTSSVNNILESLDNINFYAVKEDDEEDELIGTLNKTNTDITNIDGKNISKMYAKFDKQEGAGKVQFYQTYTIPIEKIKSIVGQDLTKIVKINLYQYGTWEYASEYERTETKMVAKTTGQTIEKTSYTTNVVDKIEVKKVTMVDKNQIIVKGTDSELKFSYNFSEQNDRMTKITEWDDQFLDGKSYLCEHGTEYYKGKNDFFTSDNYNILKKLCDSDYVFIAPKSMTIVILDPTFDITPYEGLITIQKISDETRKKLENGEEITITTGTGDTKESFKIKGSAKSPSIQFIDEKIPDTGHKVFPGDTIIDGYCIAVRYSGLNTPAKTLEETERLSIKPFEHLYKLKTMMDIEFNGGLGLVGEYITLKDTEGKYTTKTVENGTYETDSYIHKTETVIVTSTGEEIAVIPEYETITTKITEPFSYSVDVSLFPLSIGNFKYEENDKVSYLGMDIGDLNCTVNETGTQKQNLTLTMKKDANVFKDETDKIVKNENPIIYVKMPGDFNYTVKNVTMDQNAYITIDKSLNENGEIETGWYTTKIDGEYYIVIKCKGTYDSSLLQELKINIDYTRQLNTQDPAANQTVIAYMITDNENYATNVSNTLNLSANDGSIPSTIYSVKSSFTISRNLYTQLVNKVECITGISYIPDVNRGKLTKSNPEIFSDNSEIPYMAELTNELINLKDITLVARLPIQGNQSVKLSDSDSYELLEDGYTLPNEFFANREKVGENFRIGDAISEISLISLRDVEVYTQGRRGKVQLDSSLYTLEYSNSGTVGFDTPSGTNPDTQFVTLTEDADLLNAKSLRVKTSSDYVLEKQNKLILSYKMTMPDAEGMVGATSGAKYTEVDTEKTVTTDATPAYVINGETYGTVEVTKKYEGYNLGIAPEGASLQNVGFKLVNLETEETLINDGTDANGVVFTNAEGKAIFTSVMPGSYRLVETTNTTGYVGIKETQLTVDAQEKIQITAENQKLGGDIEIHKSWEDTNEQIGSAIFRITRVADNTNDKIFYSVNVKTDAETGIAKVVGLPYGTYRITEVSNQRGWILNTNSENDYIEFIVDKPESTVDIENKIGRAKELKIVKTIPTSDAENNLIEGLTFKVTGYGYANYTNKAGESVTTNYSKTVTIDPTNPVVDTATGNKTAEEGISVEISQDKTTATITIADVPLGTYIIEEIDMPTIGEGQEETGRYKDLRASAQIEKVGETTTVNLSNMWKYGYLTIEKTAGLLTQSGEDVEIGDLSGFSVRITGTSLYGTIVDKVVPLDVDGKATVALEVGDYTVEETAVDGYTTYYISEENGQEIRGVNAPTVSVINGKNTIQKIYNQHTGEGYVKVVKTLEGVDDAQKVKLAGIQFKITGKDVAGQDVEELIKIDTIEEINGKNYAIGKSAKISTGGEYQIEEVESTVPDYYEGIEPMAVELSTANTEQDPLVLNIENKRCKGNLEMKTETIPAGGDLVGIVYEVTEVEFDENGEFTKLDSTTREVEGSNNKSDTSYAKLTDIPAGNYIVSLKTIPDGYKKDAPQIIEVPSYSTGYAYFEIIKLDEQENSSVKIEKQILNSAGETATTEELENAKLTESQSFEVKVTNIETEKVYYTFVKNGEISEIKNLPEGTYLIEEVYKPKYTTQGYYIITEENSEEVETPITANEEKYTFTIGTAAEGTNKVSIRIKNTINNSFPFGGQTLADNYSKYDIEKIEETVVTKSIVYIVDENNTALPGAKFKLYDSNNNLVVLGTVGNVFVSNNRKLEIKGLPIGKYTLKCVEVPDGYLIPKDKELMVYSDAVRVVRVEIKVNNPRGNIKLSTVYTANVGTQDEKEKFVSRSKYKVVDSQTGEIVKFVKTLDGNYEKTNLPTGLDTVSVKSGYITLEGIEVGNYQIGLVDVTEGFAITTDGPADVQVAENEEISVKTQVKKMGIVQISAGEYRTLYLDENGDLWFIGSGEYGIAGNIDSLEYVNDSQNFRPQQIKFPQGIKIKKFSQSEQMVVAVDTNGKVWTWGCTNYYGSLGIIGTIDSQNCSVTCISDQEQNPLNMILQNEPDFEIVEVSAANYAVTALDNKGRVWVWGTNTYHIPTCITTIEGNALNIAFKDNIKISKLGEFSSGFANTAVIDNQGRVWILNLNTNEASCISDEYSEPLYGINATKVIIQDTNIVLDDCGNVWIWNNNSQPQMMNNSKFGNARIIDIEQSYNFKIALDENGKVWTWGTNNNGQLGIGSDEYLTIENPICLQEDETQALYGTKVIKISVGSAIIILDNENRLWGWGHNGTYGELGNTYHDLLEPTKISIIYNEKLEYDLKFVDIKGIPYSPATAALDNYGRVWGWGDVDGNGIGLSPRGNRKYIPQLLNIQSKVAKIDSTVDMGIALDKDGQIYLWGETNCKTILEDAGYYYSGPIKVKMSYFEDLKIIDICGGYRNIVALDEKGQVWIFDNTSESIPKKLEFKYSNGIVCNKKIMDISVGYYSGIAIDEDGKIWTWGRKGYTGLSELYITTVVATEELEPICLSEIPENSLQVAYENNIRFTKISNNYSYPILIDNSGKLWVTGNNKEFICISDIEAHPLYQASSDYKIVDIGSEKYTGEEIIAIDSNGDLWDVTDTTATKMNGSGTLLENLKIQKFCCISSSSSYGLIDNNGMIWTYGDNYYGQLGDGTLFDRDLVCLYDGIKNTFYGKKVTDIISDTFVETEDGKIYSITNGKSEYYMESSKYIENNDLGQIKQVEYSDRIDENGYTEDRLFAIAVDEDGKVWTWGYESAALYGDGTNYIELKTIPKCISDIETNPLYLAKQANPEFKIESIEIRNYGNSSYYPSKTILAKDNQGGVWIWGTTVQPQYFGTYFGENSTLNIPYCLNPEGSILGGKEIEKIYLNTERILILSEGKVYSVGSAQGISGFNTNKTELTIISDVNGELTGIKNIISDGYMVLAYSDNSVWTWGSNYKGELGTGNTTTQNIPIKILNDINVKDAKIENSGCVVLDTFGKVWTWGSIDDYVLGYIPTEIYGYKTPACISDDISSPLYGKSISEILEEPFSDGIIVKDNTGVIWGWGSRRMKKIPTQITEIFNNEIIMVYGTSNDANANKFIKALNIGQTIENGILYNTSLDKYGELKCYISAQVKNLECKDYSLHKLLDNNGNLYVWGIKTGTSMSLLKPTCLNELEEITEPVFTTGWTKIQKQY